jgi:hypothetical protein
VIPGYIGSAQESGAVAFSAEPTLAVGAVAGPDLEALWAAYQRAALTASSKWEQWRMMRQAGGTDGSAGFLYGQAYEAENAKDIAYAACLAARKRAFPGAGG